MKDKMINAGDLDALIRMVQQEAKDHPTISNADRHTLGILCCCASTLVEMKDALEEWNRFATEYSPLIGRALSEHVQLKFRMARELGRKALH